MTSSAEGSASGHALEDLIDQTHVTAAGEVRGEMLHDRWERSILKGEDLLPYLLLAHHLGEILPDDGVLPDDVLDRLLIPDLRIALFLFGKLLDELADEADHVRISAGLLLSLGLDRKKSVTADEDGKDGPGGMVFFSDRLLIGAFQFIDDHLQTVSFRRMSLVILKQAK